MSQITSYCYDASGSSVYLKSTAGNYWLNASPTSKSGWELEEATHTGECDVTLTLTIWLKVEDGIITRAAYDMRSLGIYANALCVNIQGMSVADAKEMLDRQPAGQSPSRSAVAAALAAALASGD